MEAAVASQRARRWYSSSASSGAIIERMALAISSCSCGVRGIALSLCGSGGFTRPALCNAPAPRSLERDIDGAQPTVGAIDLEADGPAFEERARVLRQVRAMHEYVAQIPLKIARGIERCRRRKAVTAAPARY
jgi:hypothetical protein